VECEYAGMASRVGVMELFLSVLGPTCVQFCATLVLSLPSKRLLQNVLRVCVKVAQRLHTKQWRSVKLFVGPR
jgi:hypothetical protein